MFQNIIFDWSGVICDNTYSVYQTAMEIFKTFGAKEITFEEFRREWTQPYMKFYNRFIPNLTLEEEQLEFQKVIVKFDHNTAYSGISNLLQKFYNSKINLFVISSDHPVTLFPQIEKFELNKIFKEVVCDVHDKTQTAQLIIDKYNILPSQTIIIGDSNHEIEAGKKAGIKTGAVTWGICLEEKLKSFQPDYIIHNLIELEKTILG